MSPITRLRLLTSLGLGAVVAVGGSIVGYLLLQAAGLFGWPVIIAVGALAAIVALIVEMVTPDTA